MRNLPIQYGTIQIASVSGELRYINVSGLVKARLLWLFRNFYILDFPVLNKNQKQLIARVWHTGTSAGSVDASPELIGTIDGFSPQLYRPPVPSVPNPRSAGHDARFGLLSGLRSPAIWTAMGVLLLGGAIVLGSKPRLIPQPRVAAAAPADAPTSVKSTVTAPVRAFANSAPSQPAPSVAELPAASTEVSSVAPLHLPDAMAHSASLPQVQPPPPQLAANATASGRRPEVVIRISVDAEGRPQSFHVLRGDQKRRSAALNAARHWSFQPCSNSFDCEHLLKFTDYGDASMLRLID
jgi:hypothetical protein